MKLSKIIITLIVSLNILNGYTQESKKNQKSTKPSQIINQKPVKSDVKKVKKLPPRNNCLPLG